MKLRLLVVLAGLLMFSGCSVTPSIHPQDLQVYSSRLSHLDSVYDKWGLVYQSSGTYMAEEARLSVRRRGDHFKAIGEKEIGKLKAAIFKEIGRKFPLKIEPYTLNPSSPTISGQITAMDKGRYLIVSTDRLLRQGSKEPDAKWMSPAEDALIVLHPSAQNNKADQPAIGYTVKAWSEALELTSYPSQTTLLVLEVTDANAGDGDLQGIITGLDAGKPPATPRRLEIDGKSYTLADFALFQMGDKKAGFEELKKGDRVRVWTAGYQTTPEEQIITQVVVTQDS